MRYAPAHEGERGATPQSATLTNADGFLFEFACADPAVIADWFRQAGIDWPGGEFPCIAGDAAVQISVGRYGRC